MPKRNRVKIYGSEQYYHLYNRGVNKQAIFKAPEDYFYFLSLFKRYLSHAVTFDSSGRPCMTYNDEVELVSFCLMPNHFHLLCYLKQPEGIVHLMRSAMTAYSMYFNKKYQRTGGLYEGPFLASHIGNEAYLWHVSRYIHLNPLDIGQDLRQYPYSSIAYFAGEKSADWLQVEKLVETPHARREYLAFVTDYETIHQETKQLKNILAAS